MSHPVDVSREPLATVALVTLSLLTNLLFSGMVFGWAPLKLMLDKDGVYGALCTGDRGQAEGTGTFQDAADAGIGRACFAIISDAALSNTVPQPRAVQHLSHHHPW